MDGTGIDDPLRTSSQPPRRRGGAVFALLAVIAGFAGGFTAGYAANDDDEASATVAAIDADGGDGSASAETASGYGAAPEEGGVATTALDAGPVMPTRQRLFKRESSSGHSVRVLRNEWPNAVPPGCAEEEGSWCPPPQCFPTQHLEVYVVGEWSITQGGAGWFPVREGASARLLGAIHPLFGDDDVMFGVIVRTAPGVRSVRFSVGDQRDEMAPIDDVAVLVVPIAAADGEPFGGWPSDARIEVVDGSGATTELRVTEPADPACIPPPPPPPTLPAPGEQPDDPAAAEADVRQLVDDVFGPETPDALERRVDDPTGLVEARDKLRERYPDQSTGESEYEVGELVFTSPTEAVFQFRAIVPDYGTLPWRIGSARLVDGEWKLTRSSVCTLFALGGITC